jgi:hypothetical protein
LLFGLSLYYFSNSTEIILTNEKFVNSDNCISLRGRSSSYTGGSDFFNQIKSLVNTNMNVSKIIIDHIESSKLSVTDYEKCYYKIVGNYSVTTVEQGFFRPLTLINNIPDQYFVISAWLIDDNTPNIYFEIPPVTGSLTFIEPIICKIVIETLKPFQCKTVNHKSSLEIISLSFSIATSCFAILIFFSQQTLICCGLTFDQELEAKRIRSLFKKIPDSTTNKVYQKESTLGEENLGNNFNLENKINNNITDLDNKVDNNVENLNSKNNTDIVKF